MNESLISDNLSDKSDKKAGPVAKKYSFLEGAYEMVIKGPFNILLLAAPVAFACQAFHAPDVATFIFALIGIAPLAERLGFITEQMAMHTNDTIGGLLNVTFGNATELIVAAVALYKGYYRVVQLTLLGSVLSNLLLVLGSAFLLGGIKFSVQRFGQLSSDTNVPLLLLTAMSIIFPTILNTSGTVSSTGALQASRCSSLVLLALYCIFLVFQLKTHRQLFDDEENEKEPLLPYPPAKESTKKGVVSVLSPMAKDGVYDLSSDGRSERSGSKANTDVESLEAEHGNLTSSAIKALDSSQGRAVSKDGQAENNNDGDDEEEEDVLGIPFSLFWLMIVTVLISFLSDALVATIEGAASGAGISNVFLAAIVIPIIGNAAEHTSAIIFGMKNRLNLSLGIAIGSGTQIALFLLPLLVLAGWCVNEPMSLVFQPFECAVLVLSVVLVGFVLRGGQSTYLDGVTLIGTYIVICGGFWVQKSEADLNNG